MGTRRKFLKYATFLSLLGLGGCFKDSNPYFDNRVEFYKANEPFSNDVKFYIEELERDYKKIGSEKASIDEQKFLDLKYDNKLEILANRGAIPKEILDSGDKLSELDFRYLYTFEKIVGGF